MNKYRIILVGATWGGCSDDDDIDFYFKTIEETFEKAKFFSHVMLTLDPKNPDVLETSEKMGFIP